MDRVLTTLPPLREELQLLPGPAAFDGSPTWSLYDPAMQRFYRIGQTECDMLAAWHLSKPAEILRQINRSRLSAVDEQDLVALHRFLLGHNLLQLQGLEAVQHYCRQLETVKRAWWSRLVQQYLFFKIPLVHPDGFLRRTYPYVRGLYNFRIVYLLMAMLAINLYVLIDCWELFMHTFLHFATTTGLCYYVLTLVLVKVCHELGHAYTAHRYGCRVATMGVAFLVLVPVLYTDTSDAWKLKSRQQRMAIAAAGVMVELAIAILCTSLWHFLPDGVLRSSMFLLATSTWTLTLLINLNPFMRFDGYYLLSDWLRIENLQPRAFALGRWQLRRLLFNWEETIPEVLPKRLQQGLILYAWGTWIYRLLLFLGIALLVYHFFFKALGLLLMLVEIIGFIVWPVYKELRHWYRHQAKIAWNPRSVVNVLILLSALLAVLVPWQHRLKVPALLSASKQSEIFLPVPGELLQINVAQGDYVESGQVLARFSSSSLQAKIEQAESKLASLRWQLAFHGQEARLNQRRRLTQSELEGALSEYRSRLDEQQRLVITAPFAGFIVDINAELAAGQWFARNEPLVKLARFDDYKIEAYVGENALTQVMQSKQGVFYPEQIDWPSMPCKIVALDNAASGQIPAAFADRYHGDIAVKAENKDRLIPQASVFRLTLQAEHVQPTIFRSLRGHVMIDAPTESLFVRLWKQAAAAVIGEFGF